MIYYLVFIALSILVLMSVKATNKQMFVLTCFAFCIVVLFQGLRWERGTDWDPYYYMFYYPVDEPKWYYEYAWYQLNDFVNRTTGSFTIRLIIESAAILLLNLRFAKYIGLENKTAIVLSCFSSCVFPVRFAIASGIVLNAYQFLIERKFLFYCLLVMLASTIHMASLLVLPAYFIPRRFLKLRILLLLYLISILLSYAAQTVLSYLSWFNALLGAGMDADLQDKVDDYLTDNKASYYSRSVLAILFSYVNAAFFICLFHYFLRKIKNIEKFSGTLSGQKFINQYTMLLNMYVIGLCFNRIVQFSVPYLSRIGILVSAGFTWMLLLGIERLYPKRKFLFYFLWIIYMFLSYYSILDGQYHKLFFPYKSILD